MPPGPFDELKMEDQPTYENINAKETNGGTQENMLFASPYLRRQGHHLRRE